MPSKANFDHAAFAETLHRIQRGSDAASDNPKPDFDEQQARDVKEAAMGGRKPETYAQALLYHGFFFVPKHRLAVLPGGAYPTEGMWYHRALRMAFPPSGLAADFPGGPEEFDRFIREQKHLKRQAQQRALGVGVIR